MSYQLEMPDLADQPFGLRVRTLRTAWGYTQDELAQHLKTTKATISKIERSTTRPTIDWAERIAKVFNVRPTYLITGKAEMITLEGMEPGTIMVPVIGMIAAGNWREAIQTPDEQIVVAGAKPHMFALRIQGDSIDRVAPDGSYVTIDPTLPSLREGKLYAVQNGDGESTIKRFRVNPDRLEPDSTNAIHKPIILGEEPITIIGQATSVTRPL